MITRKYYYSKLTPLLCGVLNNIIGKLQKHESVITIISPSVTAEQIGELFDIIDKDFPEIFFIDIKKSPIEIAVYGAVKKITVNYLYDIKETQHIQMEIQQISTKIIPPEILSDSILKREKIIHDYLADKVVYHYNSRDTMDYTIVGPILNGQAICEGYAKAFKYICEQSQLNCLVVSGRALNSKTGKIENHAWNIIYIGDGEYVHVDVTWDSGKYQGLDTMYNYYNLGDKTIETDHYWDRKLVPICKGVNNEVLITLDSALELADYITMKLSNEVTSLDFRVNKHFQSTEELVELISKILHKRNLMMVRSFKLIYNPNTQSAHCEFDVLQTK